MVKGSEIILILVHSLCISHSVMATSVREVTFEDTGYDDFLFNEDIVFETMSRSRLDCGRYCKERGNCVGFTHAMGSGSEGMPGICRGYSHSNISGSSSAKAGAKTFTRTRTAEKEKSSSSAWLGKSCIEESDCPIFFNTLCITGQCLCRPEHYFSNGSDTCVETCAQSDVGTTFLVYPETAVWAEHSYIDHYDRVNLALCQSDCVEHPECRSVLYSFFEDAQTGTCMRFRHALITDVYVENDALWNLYKRTCA